MFDTGVARDRKSIIYLDYLCNFFECIICKMSQKDQPSINYPVCVIDETDELRTDFKIGTFLTKQTRFLLILGKSSSRLYNRSSTQTLPWVSTLLNLIAKSWKIHPEFFPKFQFFSLFYAQENWSIFRPEIGLCHASKIKN